MTHPVELPAAPTFVVVGDSFSEGLNDPYPAGPDGIVTYRGWADRVAQRLAESSPDLRYANLAIRGKLLRQVLRDQLPVAVEMRPDLVSLCAGGNDVLRPGSDPDALARAFEFGVRKLRASGAQVLLFTGMDPHDVPVLRRLRGRIAVYNMHLRAIADRCDCRVVDMWAMAALRDPRAWSEDRLHLSPEGHRRMALRVCEVLGVPVEDDWRAPWPALPADRWVARRGADLRWARSYFAPWVRRRLTGRSSGDGLSAKRPDPSSL